MKNNVLILCCMSFFFLQCKKEVDDPEIIIADLEANTCYEFSDGQNFATIKIDEVKPKVKATLNYNFKQQEIKDGSFEGTLEGNILKGNFTFHSNGVLAKEEVVFLVEEGKLSEGILKKNGNSAKDVSFTHGYPFYQVFCSGSNCKFHLGYVYSNILDTCIAAKEIAIVLDPLENGISTSGPKAYVLIDELTDTVEIFLPDYNEGIILERTEQGHWSNDVYRFFDWKGWVLQQGDMAIFGGY